MPQTSVQTISRERAEELREQIEQIAVDWLGEPGDRDWDRFLERVEQELDIDLPATYDDPLLKKIQRWSRDAWREANE